MIRPTSAGYDYFVADLRGYDLKADTKYSYVACFKVSNSEFFGEIMSFTTLKDPNLNLFDGHIVIDGDFSDWAKLDSKKVVAAKTLTDDETSYTALKTVMVYADKNSVFIRFSFDKDQMSMDYAPFHIWIDSDNDESTGGYAGNFTESSIDVMLEGTFIDGSEFVSYDPSVYQWIGEPQASGWDWDELLAGGSGLCSGAGNGTEYEIELVRELFPLGQLPDEFRIGFDIQYVDGEDWNTVGLLPNGAPTNDNAGGLAPMLKVVTVK
ncbi:MAG: hypothetical protein II542_05040 [Bacteroidales bacterium]|nr:hypothetical protein [Bacteroidales bacterium]